MREERSCGFEVAAPGWRVVFVRDYEDGNGPHLELRSVAGWYVRTYRTDELEDSNFETVIVAAFFDPELGEGSELSWDTAFPGSPNRAYAVVGPDEVMPSKQEAIAWFLKRKAEDEERRRANREQWEQKEGS